MRGKLLVGIFIDGNSQIEHVAYVGVDGQLYSGRWEGGVLTVTAISPPSGKTLTGNVAVGTVFDSFWGRYQVVAATTTANDLYIYNGAPFNNWLNVSGGLAWSAVKPIDMSTSDDRLSVFGSHFTDGPYEVGLARGTTGGSWTVYDLGKPSGSPGACDSIAAAEGQITSSTYRLYVVCSPTSSASALYFLYTYSKTATTFYWIESSLANDLLTSQDNIVGATYRPDASAVGAIDMFALGRDSSDEPYIYHRVRDSGGLHGLSGLITGNEDPDIWGAVTAAPTKDDYSRVIFVDGSRGYLLERSSTSLNDTEQMQNYGNEDRSDLAFQYNEHAEGMLAEWGNYLSIATINRPGPGDQDWPRIHVVRSDDDGQTFGSLDVLTNVVGGETYQYNVDPTVAVTRSGRTYVLQFAQQYEHCNNPVKDKAAVWLSYADAGSSTWTNILVQTQEVGPNGKTLDHPFMAIERGASSTPDRLHMAWWNAELDDMEYAYYDDGLGLSSIRTLRSSNSGPAFVTGNDSGDVVVYFTDSTLGPHIEFCELNPSLTGCTAGIWQEVDDDNIRSQILGIPIDSATPATYVQTLVPYSMAVSPTENGILHACFQVEETDGDGTHTDVACTRGVADGNGNYTWSPLVYPGPKNDDKWQFNPGVSVSEPTYTFQSFVADEGLVYVTWYELEGVLDNYTYRTMMTQSVNGGSTFYPEDEISAIVSDPEYLPRHCQRPPVRFIGDYSAVTAAPLHTHALYVGTPDPPNVQTWVRITFQSLGSWSGAPGP